MIQTAVKKTILEKAVEQCRRKNVIIPKFSELRDPSKIPAKIKEKLKSAGLWDVDPANLFRITWKNDAQAGLFGGVNYFEIPRELTGIEARIVGLVGKWFPTGAHKVGAAFGCLVPRLVSGEFDPTTQKAVWPSTGNYCRGGVFDCAVLGCEAVAILPEGMSKERFEWLKKMGAEVIATPGTESNVKEIYDKCWEIKKTKKNYVIFNQFEEFGNPLWHYNCTGPAIEEAFSKLKKPKSRLAGYISATGSAGTIAAGDYLRTVFPHIKVAASEALQCPTLMMNGFGSHRIEGIGDKHVPWIHNVRNTDAIVAIDDESVVRILRLFNEPAGKKALAKNKVSSQVLENLPLLGFSGICNMLSAVKMAKYFEMGKDDILFTIFTDSAELYQSRLKEMTEERGAYTENEAMVDWERHLRGVGIDWLKELGYYDKKALHNLKYFTWVEQQGKTVEDLHRLWDPDFWAEEFSKAAQYDAMIEDFNKKVGLL